MLQAEWKKVPTKAAEKHRANNKKYNFLRVDKIGKDWVDFLRRTKGL